MKVVFSNLTLCILLCACMITGLHGQEKLKVLSYNVMHGFEGDATRISRYVEWLSTGIVPDIVLYQEMNGFTRQKLTDLAARYGHGYAVILNEESGYDATHPLPITSK